MRPNFAIFEVITDPIFVYDARGQIVFRNGAAESAYGWTAEQVLGNRTDLSIEWATSEADDIIGNELHKERYWRGEVSRRLRDGRDILVDCQLIALLADDGSLGLTMDLRKC